MVVIESVGDGGDGGDGEADFDETIRKQEFSASKSSLDFCLPPHDLLS